MLSAPKNTDYQVYPVLAKTAGLLHLVPTLYGLRANGSLRSDVYGTPNRVMRKQCIGSDDVQGPTPGSMRPYFVSKVVRLSA